MWTFWKLKPLQNKKGQKNPVRLFVREKNAYFSGAPSYFEVALQPDFIE